MSDAGGQPTKPPKVPWYKLNPQIKGYYDPDEYRMVRIVAQSLGMTVSKYSAVCTVEAARIALDIPINSTLEEARAIMDRYDPEMLAGSGEAEPF